MLIIRTDKQANQAGEQVRLTLTWHNDSGKVREAQFQTAQRFDVLVARDGLPVWRWSDGQHFAQVQAALRIAPGDSRVFRIEWCPLTAGEYEVLNWIVGTDQRATCDVHVAEADATASKRHHGAEGPVRVHRGYPLYVRGPESAEG